MSAAGFFVSKANLVIALFVLLNFHTLARLSPVFYLLPLTLYAILFYSLGSRGLTFQKRNTLFFAYLSFLAVGLYMFAVTVLKAGIGDALYGLLRFFFVMPIGVLVYDAIRKEEQVRRILYLFVIFAAIAAFTMPLQAFFVGEIPWFADSHMRSGIIRYSSLMGNLAALGIAGGMGLVICLLLPFKSRTLKLFLTISIIIGMSMSLQRAATANIIIAFATALLFSNISFQKKTAVLLFSAFAVGVMFTLLLHYPDTQVYASFFLKSLGLSSGVDTMQDYKPIYESIGYRLIGNTVEHFEPFSLLEMFVGLGYQGIGGVLGQKGYFAHNDFVNLVSIGGLGLLAIFSFICANKFMVFRVYLRKYQGGEHGFRNTNLRCLYASFILFMANFPMGSGTFVHPNQSILFWTTVGLLSGYYARVYAWHKNSADQSSSSETKTMMKA